jgi:hypothetical protein
MKLLLKILLLILLPWLADAIRPAGPVAPEALPRAGEVGAAAHGAYCAPAGEGAVFLGRDVPELGSYGAFQEWCTAQGGVARWSA